LRARLARGPERRGAGRGARDERHHRRRLRLLARAEGGEDGSHRRAEDRMIARIVGRALVPIRLALRAIRRNVMRATLTVLGILIGVAAVVVVTSLGAGARDAVSRQLDSLGSNVIFI